MSELTSCNYCNHRRLLADAKRCGMRVTVLPENWGMGGVGAYMHPRGVKIEKLKPEDRKKYHRAWYMHLGDQCGC